MLLLVLHDISIYRIDIECEFNIDYEYLLKPTSNDIEIELKYCPNRCNLSDIELHSAKIHERNVILVMLEGYLVSFWKVRAKPVISKIKFEGAYIESFQNTDIVQR